VTAPGIDIASVDRALKTLGKHIVLHEEAKAQSHIVLRAEGITDPDAVAAFGIYLAAALAGAVKVDTTLAARFLGLGVDRRLELRRRVHAVVGESNTVTTKDHERWRETRRDPWIAEGIGHLLMMLASRKNTGCLAGLVAAVKQMHARTTQQGLDLVAIYLVEDELPALAIGEGKATFADPSSHLTAASHALAAPPASTSPTPRSRSKTTPRTPAARTA
jgi:hypothetical protein